MHEQIRLSCQRDACQQLSPSSLNVQADSICAKVFVQPPPLCKSVVTLDLAFVNFILICSLDSHRNVGRFLSLVFTCLCITNSLLLAFQRYSSIRVIFLSKTETKIDDIRKLLHEIFISQLMNSNDCYINLRLIMFISSGFEIRDKLI